MEIKEIAQVHLTTVNTYLSFLKDKAIAENAQRKFEEARRKTRRASKRH